MRCIVVLAIFFGLVSSAEARHRHVAPSIMQPFAWPNLFSKTNTVHVRHHRARHARVRHGRHHATRAAHGHSTSLAGVAPRLATKITSIVGACGSQIVSTVRHTFVAGTHRLSQHANGTAVDITRNPSCIYSMLHGWPGGYSTDYGRVHHVHISIGGREEGLRFVHGGHRRHYAHHSSFISKYPPTQ
jgi:hypothetical protein